MAAEERPKIVVEKLPGGGKRWRRSDADLLLKKPDNFPHRMGSPSNFLSLYQRYLAAVDGFCKLTDKGSLQIPDDYSADELSGLQVAFSRRCTAEFTRLLKDGHTAKGFDYHRLAGHRHFFHALALISQAEQLSWREIDPGAINGEDRRRHFKKGDEISRGVLGELTRALGILEMYYARGDDAAAVIRDEEDDDYVTLDQAGAMCKKRKRTLEGYLSAGKIPRPDIEGGHGKASLWRWSRLREALQPLVGIPLPSRFPAIR